MQDDDTIRDEHAERDARSDRRSARESPDLRPPLRALATTALLVILVAILSVALLVGASAAMAYASVMAARKLGLPEVSVTLSLVALVGAVVVVLVGTHIARHVEEAAARTDRAVEDAADRVADAIGVATEDLSDLVADVPAVFVESGSPPRVAPHVRARGRRRHAR